MNLPLLLLALAACLARVSADIYMLYPPASNNRLDEASRDRANANRVFDSQNNNRGGVNVQNTYYHPGSRLYVEWTNQHSCGGPNNNCEIILQYTCDSRIRDGTTTNTIPTDPNQCIGWDCDTDVRYGRHESWESYKNCLRRERNKGLWTSNQKLNGNSARFTRQNNNGNRRGLECPEERDYFPYWHPTMWRDIAILTNQPQRCPSYQRHSQNVEGRWYCDAPAGWVASKGSQEGFVPIDQWRCEQITFWNTQTNQTEHGRWRYVPSWGLPPPLCREAPWTRDNHLGNSPRQGLHAEAATYNWTLPDLSAFHPHWAAYGDSVLTNWASYAAQHGSAEAARHLASSPMWAELSENRQCVVRIRYNISTADTEHFSANTRRGQWADAGASTQAQIEKLGSNLNHLNSTALDANRDPALTDVWSRFNIPYDEVEDSFNRDINNNQATLRNSREYVLKNNPKVNIFGSLLSSLRVGAAVKLQLAVNTAQFGRTFQDRSHAFRVLPLPTNIESERRRPAESDEAIARRVAREMRDVMAQGSEGWQRKHYTRHEDGTPTTMDNLANEQGLPVIHNINVRGKRGNIVQTFPSVEYDFVPNDLKVTRGDYVHFQWAGSNTNPGNNAGQGQAGSDRHNVVGMRPAVFLESPSAAYGAQGMAVDGSRLMSQRTSLYPTMSGVTAAVNQKGQWGRSFPEMDIGGFAATVERGVRAYPWRFLGLDFSDLRLLATLGSGGEMSELDDASTYFDLGPRRVTEDGIYNYLCTRNNNFSNRSQKGQITISTTDQISQPIGWNGGVVHAAGAVVSIATNTLAGLEHVHVATTPARHVHGSVLASRDWVASKYVFIGPHDLNLVRESGKMRIHIDHSEPWYALGTYKVYYAPDLSGPWKERDATFSGARATTNSRNGGVFVVVAEPMIGGLFAISLLIVLVLAAGVWAYRRRKRGQPLLPGAEDPLNQKV